jgi:hypothetical protein
MEREATLIVSALEGVRAGGGEPVVVSEAGDCGEMGVIEVHPPDTINIQRVTAEKRVNHDIP